MLPIEPHSASRPVYTTEVPRRNSRTSSFDRASTSDSPHGDDHTQNRARKRQRSDDIRHSGIAEPRLSDMAAAQLSTSSARPLPGPATALVQRLSAHLREHACSLEIAPLTNGPLNRYLQASSAKINTKFAVLHALALHRVHQSGVRPSEAQMRAHELSTVALLSPNLLIPTNARLTLAMNLLQVAKLGVTPATGRLSPMMLEQMSHFFIRMSPASARNFKHVFPLLAVADQSRPTVATCSNLLHMTQVSLETLPTLRPWRSGITINIAAMIDRALKGVPRAPEHEPLQRAKYALLERSLEVAEVGPATLTHRMALANAILAAKTGSEAAHAPRTWALIERTLEESLQNPRANQAARDKSLQLYGESAIHAARPISRDLARLLCEHVTGVAITQPLVTTFPMALTTAKLFSSGAMSVPRDSMQPFLNSLIFHALERGVTATDRSILANYLLAADYRRNVDLSVTQFLALSVPASNNVPPSRQEQLRLLREVVGQSVAERSSAQTNLQRNRLGLT